MNPFDLQCEQVLFHGVLPFLYSSPEQTIIIVNLAARLFLTCLKGRGCDVVWSIYVAAICNATQCDLVLYAVTHFVSLSVVNMVLSDYITSSCVPDFEKCEAGCESELYLITARNNNQKLRNKTRNGKKRMCLC